MPVIVGYLLAAVSVCLELLVGATWNSRFAGPKASAIRIVMFVVAVILATKSHQLISPDIGLWVWGLLFGTLPIVIGILVLDPVLGRFSQQPREIDQVP